MIINPKVVKIAGDAIIPLLGFFVWDWSLYFIFLYYILDLISREVIVHIKARRIATHSTEKLNGKMASVALSLLLLSGIIGLMHLTAFHTNFRIEFWAEILSFLSYADMGIPQGYVLVPLIAFASYVTYKTEFLLPRLFLRMSQAELWKSHIKHSLLLLLLGLVVTISSIFLSQFPWILFLLIITSIAGYQLLDYRNKR